MSVVPPVETQSCHIDLYYNGNILLDTFYVFKDRQPISGLKVWKIRGYGNQTANWENAKDRRKNQDIYYQYNMDHYYISLNVSNDYGISEGKNKERKKIIIF